MKYAVLYSSKTGNTKQLSDCLMGLLGNKARCIEMTPGMPAPEEDLLLIGYWVDKGTCPEEVKELLQRLEGKKILFFATAGFGQTQSYFSQIAAGVEALAKENNEVLGSFFCQGRMPEGIRARYEAMLRENPEDKKARVFLHNFEQALCHPNAEDLKNLLDFAVRLLPEEIGKGENGNV